MQKIIRMLSALLCVAALAFVFMPSASYTEDKDTILLARTIYALGKDESYATKLALGSVVMNRVDSPWFAGDLGEVLDEQQQFPAGRRYDGESLQAAHALISGARSLDSSALYYQAADATDPWGEENLVATSGGYNFYSRSGNL